MSEPQIDPVTEARIATYQAVMERDQSEPDFQAPALIAVRLLIGRRGYSQTLRMLQKRGVPWVADNALAEFNELQAFMAKLLAEYSDDEVECHQVAEDMAAMLAELHSVPGRAYLHKLLARLQRRAAWWFATPAPTLGSAVQIVASSPRVLDGDPDPKFDP